MTLRLRKGLLSREWRLGAGWIPTHLSGIERGIRNPSLRNIRAIAEALGVGVAQLFEFESDWMNERVPTASDNERGGIQTC